MCDTQCMCLPSLTGTFCGWIDKQDGVIHPCAPGCCNPACSEPAPSSVGEYKQTRGVALPPGFGANIQTNDLPTDTGGAPFEPVGRTPEPPYHRRFFFMLLLIAIMVYMALLLV